MKLPDYWLTRPHVDSDANSRAALDHVLNAASAADCATLKYDGPWPKWQFLCHVAEQHDIALHGSGEAHISEFEPRHSNDLSEFGAQNAVYAAADGIWALFFAITDRQRIRSVSNACMRVVDETGNRHGPYYVFSVDHESLHTQPWRPGTVYLLPRKTFAAQQPTQVGSLRIEIPQLASTEPVRPIAKLDVAPEDFPFLRHIRKHDHTRLEAHWQALQTGAPWPDVK